MDSFSLPTKHLKYEAGAIKLYFLSSNFFCRLVYLPKQIIDFLDNFSLTSPLESAQNIYCLSKCNLTTKDKELEKIFSYGRIAKHSLRLLPVSCRPAHDYYKNNTFKFQGKNLFSFKELLNNNFALIDASLIDTDETDWLKASFKKTKLKKAIGLEDFVSASGLGKATLIGDRIFLEGYPWPLSSFSFYKALFSYYTGKDVHLAKLYQTSVPSAEFVIGNEISE